MKTVLACLLLVFAINSASSTCLHKPPTFKPYKWEKDMVTFCEYEKMKLTVNSTFTDLESCQHCTCTMSGLNCCGIGIQAGLMMPKTGCTFVSDFCKPVQVNKAKTALCKA